MIFFSILTNSVKPPAPWGPQGTHAQIQYQREELAAFVHYGMNTYTGVEWGNGHENEDLFNPTNLNTDQWVTSIQKAGFKRLIFVGKHHDGFCIWKTNYTVHNVNRSAKFQATSKQRGQSGDVIEELSKSCSKYNMNMGFYLSPLDMNNSAYGNEELYNEFYMNQLREILGNKKYGNNGKFVEVWMDGAKSEAAKDQKYWFLKWFDIIDKLQPDSVVFSPYGSTVRWIGNERGYAGNLCWSRVNLSRMRGGNTIGLGEYEYYFHGDPDGDIWSVGECDVSITSGWFWTEGRVPKSMQELADIYFNSVGHGQPLLLNVPPNKEGVLPDNMVKRLEEFGETIRKTYEVNFANQPDVKVTASSFRGNDPQFKPENAVDDNISTYWTMDDNVTKGWIEIDLGQKRTFDIVSFSEHIDLGQRVEEWFLYYFDSSKNDWVLFENGTTINTRHLCWQHPVTSQKIKLVITKSQDVPLIERIGVYKGYGAFSKKSLIPEGLTEVLAAKFNKTGNWNNEDEGIWTRQVGASVSYKFIGSKVYVVGIVDPGHGKIGVYIDGNKITVINTKADERKLRQLLYTSPDLDYGDHEIKLVLESTACALHGFYYLDNKGMGMFQIRNANYAIAKGGKVKIQVDRIGGSSGKCSVTFQTVPGTAVHGKHYINVLEKLNFEDGEKTKLILVKTIENPEITSNLTFFAQVVDPSEGSLIGFNDISEITIYDGKPIEGLIDIDRKDMDFDGSWEDKGDVVVSSDVGANIEAQFYGTKVFIIGNKSPNTGEILVFIDNKKVGIIDTHSEYLQKDQLLFTSDDLELPNSLSLSSHSIVLVLISKRCEIKKFTVLENNATGMISLENEKLTIKGGNKIDFKILRSGGNDGECSVRLQTLPGTAVEGKDYKPIDQIVSFLTGQNEKKVQIETMENDKDDVDFYLTISEPTNDVVVKFNSSCAIKISNTIPSPITETPVPPISYTSTPDPQPKNKKVMIIVISLSCGIIVVAILGFIIYRIVKSRENEKFPMISKELSSGSNTNYI
ncbi:Calx-beta domain containing protein [Trichomonas vaginalis G3]|uniref:alpha-L-fucosidase n=1 Tax=Trichomonas vaginalis (strain ATCC PRA-98 / G3) TaxID=412133 RepID=A2EHG3_TRIV3|nr:alpha-l-fucosidase family [Trichomonas vaginalis G3]EAY07941.1 Calx-beta domain containing protein [Trichomonas vaginalis G3]KAI5531251.1 alpha-l-fucosidase family [Trichomonas vaginalis G3]|eukprot:XP_001320164.1 Calx-beta domain containing protein [Trichomonas vaginalis G3]